MVKPTVRIRWIVAVALLGFVASFLNPSVRNHFWPKGSGLIELTDGPPGGDLFGRAELPARTPFPVVLAHAISHLRGLGEYSVLKLDSNPPSVSSRELLEAAYDLGLVGSQLMRPFYGECKVSFGINKIDSNGVVLFTGSAYTKKSWTGHGFSWRWDPATGFLDVIDVYL